MLDDTINIDIYRHTAVQVCGPPESADMECLGWCGYLQICYLCPLVLGKSPLFGLE